MLKFIPDFQINRLKASQKKSPLPSGTQNTCPDWLLQIVSDRSPKNSLCEVTLKHLLRPDHMMGIDQAITLLIQAKQKNWCIAILGDFDADGATACALLVNAFKQMGFQHIHFFVPNRFEHGYGLTPKMIDHMLEETTIDLIITVDNGINAFEAVEYAKQKGIKTLITDHHLPGHLMPKPDALVNPNQPGCPFASKALAGVGVAFYVVAHLKKTLGCTLDMKQFLPLVAFGTVADMVPMDTNNRILVRHGLKIMRQHNPGIDQLCSLSNIKKQQLCETDISFILAPKLNAAGRLENMSTGILCLLADSPENGRNWAKKLMQYNKKRQNIQLKMLETARRMIDEKDPLVCLYSNDFHQGIIGIIAGKMKEKYKKLSLCFAQTDQGIKGSVRSIIGLHVKDFLEAFHHTHPQHIQTFGGHAMAAGLTLQNDNFAQFKQDLIAFYNTTQNHITTTHPQSDGMLAHEAISLQTAKQIEQFGPWGIGFTKPLFEGRFELHSMQALTPSMLRLMFKINDNQHVAAIYFSDEPGDFFVGATYDALFHLEVNVFGNHEKLQMRIIEIAPSPH